MTKKRADMSLVEIRESTLAGQQGMAAARLALRVRSVMQNALQISGLSQKELADRLQLGESRVSQILHGDGNVQISTLAKVLRGMGYKIDLAVEPADDSVQPLPERRRRPAAAVPETTAAAPERKATDRITVARGGKHGYDVQAVEFVVDEDDIEACYVVTHRDMTTTLKSNGWNYSNWNVEMSIEPSESQRVEDVWI